MECKTLKVTLKIQKKRSSPDWAVEDENKEKECDQRSKMKRLDFLCLRNLRCPTSVVNMQMKRDEPENVKRSSIVESFECQVGKDEKKEVS